MTEPTQQDESPWASPKEQSVIPAAKSEEPTKHLAGIGGWLIFPAIGLILNTVGLILGIGFLVSEFTSWSQMGLGFLWGIEMADLVISTVFVLWAAILFFNKKRGAPKAYICMMVYFVLSSGMIVYFETSWQQHEMAEESIRMVFRTLVSSAVWIPYFLASKRVKATFVN